MNEEAIPYLNTTDANFEQDVLVRSESELVVVDFWAEWCAPCRAMAPIIESLATEFAEHLTLVKAETETNAEAAQEFGVTTIPAVYAVYNKQILAQFGQGPSEPALRQWLESLLSAVELENIRVSFKEDPETAEKRLLKLSEEAGGAGDAAKIILVQLLLEQNRDEECEKLISELEDRGFLEPELEKARAALSLRKGSTDDLEALQKKAAQAPDDYAIQFALAESLASTGEYEKSFDICLNLVAMDRQASGEKARQLMVDVFRVLGDDSDITREYRRKLSMALY